MEQDNENNIISFHAEQFYCSRAAKNKSARHKGASLPMGGATSSMIGYEHIHCLRVSAKWKTSSRLYRGVDEAFSNTSPSMFRT